MEPTISFGLAFLAGLLSFLSPCILPVAPGYISVISGTSIGDIQNGQFSRRKLFLTTGAFIVGFSVIFILLGMSSSFLGQLLRSHRLWISRVGGIVVILFGLHQAGWLPIAWLYQEKRINFRKSLGIWGAFLTGIFFSLGWTPCVGPILGSVLALAGSQGTYLQGIMLLSFYSLGLAIPFFMLTLAFERVTHGLSRIKPYLKYLEWLSGLLLIVIGLLLLTGSFTTLNSLFMRLTGGWSPENLLKK